MQDPQGSTAIILKPPDNFEAIYQGVSRTVPIPFVAADANGEFLALDDLAGKPGVSGDLARFVAVPLGSSALIVIPRALYSDGETLHTIAYRYDLRWRLRTLSDYDDGLSGSGSHEHPWSMLTTLGAPSLPPPIARRVMPAYTTEQVTPATTGNLLRPLVALNTPGTVTQGVYAPADFASADDALGIEYFPPYLRPIVGNELSICASFADGTWDFGSAAGDAPFSNIYGRTVAGPSHKSYPGVGIVLIVLARSTTP